MSFTAFYKTILNSPKIGFVRYREEQHQATWNACLDECIQIVRERGTFIGGAIQPHRTIEELEKLRV